MAHKSLLDLALDTLPRFVTSPFTLAYKELLIFLPNTVMLLTCTIEMFVFVSSI